MSQPVVASTNYRYLAERSDSSYRELFIRGTKVRAQSAVSMMEVEGWTAEEAAAEFRVPVEALREATDYVHANEEYLAEQRRREREQLIAGGYLRPDE